VSATIRNSDYKRESRKAMRENNTTHGTAVAAIVSTKTHTSVNGV
jgi:hypothetical protein